MFASMIKPRCKAAFLLFMKKTQKFFVKTRKMFYFLTKWIMIYEVGFVARITFKGEMR